MNYMNELRQIIIFKRILEPYLFLSVFACFQCHQLEGLQTAGTFSFIAYR